ncbi:MAG: hypothetical protein ACF8CQ_08405 [Rhodopirellula sp. JB044]|uniref:hypothetical protein n=1 Tax=Rhodopirellula sp. JB044 TaxID=3342844 RepID=UPI00370C961A
MKVLPATFSAIALLALWRVVWLTSGVPDTCGQADVAATAARLELRGKTKSSDGSLSDSPLRNGNLPWRISFVPVPRENTHVATSEPIPRLRQTGIEIWDASLPVWITPGKDGYPGWKSWDDNRNGVVDEPGELGAAWSDDFCVVQLPGTTSPSGRIIDHGGYRDLRPSDRQDHDRTNSSGEPALHTGEPALLRYRFEFAGSR